MDSAEPTAPDHPADTRARRAAQARRARVTELRAQEKRRGRSMKLAIALSTGALLAAGTGTTLWAVGATGHGGTPAGVAIPGVRTYTGLGRTHVAGKVSYPQTPPVGGNHNPVWLECTGTVYDKPVADENAVHSMEHGAVWVTYNARATPADIAKLADTVRTTPYSFMSPYPDEDGVITLTAWGTQLVLDSATDPRVEQFFTKYVQGPQAQEPGASCSPGSM
ncbi:DUF3105 domain-containing protein [Kitasatospora indigofera]|uniref:DUF3105 domain-containing protein n=1 Tax=Kitasatospora indigofera TaxID=67307 RepID=UPI00362FD9DF